MRAISLTKDEWYTWWNRMDRFTRLQPLLFLGTYWVFLLAAKGLEPPRIIVSSVIVLLYYLGPKVRPVFILAFPFLLSILAYDSQRFFTDLLRGPIHVKELYDLDKALFGIEHLGEILTPNEWMQKHPNPVLDFLCGLSYIIYIPVFLFCTAYFHFSVSAKRGHYRAARQTQYLMWSFFWVNVLGIATYMIYAASPPWYVADYGFGPVHLEVPGNSAGCARFDALTGLGIFKLWYGNSANVHGALPSLHVAYPCIAAIVSFHFGRLRTFCVGFYLLVCFAAVYLNHHYIVDVLLGSLYSAISVWLSVNLKFRSVSATVDFFGRRALPARA